MGKNKGNVINNKQFNKAILESEIASRLQTAKNLAVLKLLLELSNSKIFDLMKIKSDTEKLIKKITEKLFNLLNANEKNKG